MSRPLASQAMPSADASPRLATGARVTALGVGVSLAAPFVVLSMVAPAEAGLGTHTRLGLPTCTWPTALGIPCPSCGYTTAFTHAAHGDLWTSFLTQPAGFILALVSAMAAVVAIGAAVTAQPLHMLFAPLANRSVAWAAGAVFVVGWGYKIGSFKGWW